MRSVLTTFATGLALSISLISTPAFASENTTALGDAEAGKTKAATCAGCHMSDGNSVVASFPKIAGQQPGYIARQLANFKSGVRVDDTMKGMVAALSEQDMLDLDAYYTSQTQSPGEIGSDQAESASAGENIYRAGLAEYSVTACMACHGPDGKGLQPNFPRLSGQYASYIEKQLLAFKDGSRSDSMMNGIAFPLSTKQIKDLSVYISGLY
jgi:cytochrome c553